jgi:erythromycin esterase-like protein
MNDQIRKQIEQLRREKTKVLQSRYRELFGEASHSSNHAHLFRRIAWRLQALAEGDLSQRARDRAVALASDAELRLRAPRQFWRELDDRAQQAARDPRLPGVGTTLERRYRDQTITVKILTEGFEYGGRIYDSLSSIASSVTGTRWNGFTFFGLNKKVRRG